MVSELDASRLELWDMQAGEREGRYLLKLSSHRQVERDALFALWQDLATMGERKK